MSTALLEPTDAGTRRELLVAGAGLLVLGVAGCEDDAERSDGATRTVKTDRGPVDVPRDPKRIVVLAASLAGDLYALGAHVAAASVVALGAKLQAGFPALWSDEARRQRTEPLRQLELDIEAVAAMKPDLIVGGGQGYTGVQAVKAYDKLRAIAPTVLVSSKVTTWRGQLELLADVVGAHDAVAGLMDRYEERVDRVRGAITVPEQPTAILLALSNGKPFVVPRSAALPALLEQVGFTADDVLAKAPGTKLYGTGDSFEVSPELLGRVLDAPTLFVVSLGGPSIAELREQRIYARLPAFAAGRVHELPAFSYRPDYFAILETLGVIGAEFD